MSSLFVAIGWACLLFGGFGFLGAMLMLCGAPRLTEQSSDRDVQEHIYVCYGVGFGLWSAILLLCIGLFVLWVS